MRACERMQARSSVHFRTKKTKIGFCETRMCSSTTAASMPQSCFVTGVPACVMTACRLCVITACRLYVVTLCHKCITACRLCVITTCRLWVRWLDLLWKSHWHQIDSRSDFGDSCGTSNACGMPANARTASSTRWCIRSVSKCLWVERVCAFTPLHDAAKSVAEGGDPVLPFPIF